jgi:hypothetical protein
MSLKSLFLNYHQDIFLENCHALNDEHRKCFNEVNSALEKIYQGKQHSLMLADYCWTVARDSPGLV